jgi:predicted phosphodiesterase
MRIGIISDIHGSLPALAAAAIRASDLPDQFAFDIEAGGGPASKST